MSEENVETVRRFLRALDRVDYDEALSCLLPDAEWNNTAAFPGPRTIKGSAAIVEFWISLVEAFIPQENWLEIENLRTKGHQVVAGVHSGGHGAGSGAPVDVRWALRFWLREGRIGRVDISGNYESALEAAGLRE